MHYIVTTNIDTDLFVVWHFISSAVMLQHIRSFSIPLCHAILCVLGRNLPLDIDAILLLILPTDLFCFLHHLTKACQIYMPLSVRRMG